MYTHIQTNVDTKRNLQKQGKQTTGKAECRKRMQTHTLGDNIRVQTQTIVETLY